MLVRGAKSKVDGPSGLNWTVQATETGRSKRLKVDRAEIENWTVQKRKTVRSEVKKS